MVFMNNTGREKMITIIFMLILPIFEVKASKTVYNMRCKEYDGQQAYPSQVFHVVDVVQCGFMCKNISYCNGFSYYKSSCRTLDLEQFTNFTMEIGSSVWCQDRICPSGPCVSS